MTHHAIILSLLLLLPSAAAAQDSAAITATPADTIQQPLSPAPAVMPIAAGWRLHEGMNAAIDLSAFTSFRKNGFSGTAQRIAMMYAMRVSDKLSVAVGGAMMNMNSSRGSLREVALEAIANYRFNDHWEAFVYAQKNVSQSNTLRWANPWYVFDRYDGLYEHNPFGDRVGAGVRYNFNETTYLEVNMQWRVYNDWYRETSKPMMPGQTFAP